MKTIIYMIIFIISITALHAQISPESKLGAWYTIDSNNRVSEKFSISTCLQLRSYEITDDINLILYLASINYSVNPKTTLSVGYYNIDVDPTIGISNTPHVYINSSFEQVSYNHKLANLPITHRLRLENRILTFLGDTQVKHRIRYCIGTKIKLNSLLFINCNNEFFANLQDDVFNENRFYTALGINLNKSNNIQLGYLNNKINGANLHRLQVGLFFKTDLRKKKIES